MHAVRRTALACLIAPFVGCTIHHVTPYTPDPTRAPQTADAAAASTNCFESSTAAETAICAAPALDTANRAMIQALQQGFRNADLFGRDVLLASQRAWLLALPALCHLPDPPAPAAPAGAACLRASLQDRTAALLAWRPPAAHPPGHDAIAQYVGFHPPPGARAQPDPALCAMLAQRANDALSRTGSADPAAMGGEEIAGTHGPESSAADPRHHVAVGLYDANVFGLFQRRARSVSLDGAAPVITSLSLTELAQAQASGNAGGRFSAYASQTGDYGAIDVFRLEGRLLVLASDPWGATTPAAPGEAAHAGVWDISGPTPVPACLFDTYTRPAEPGAFAALPSFTPWRDLLTQLHDSAAPDLPIATRRDQSQLAADTAFVLLHMPLVAVQQASAGGWIAWLRHRHDAVLDALYGWSTQDPAHKPVFDRIFALLRPAAGDLVRAYQTTQGLTADEATQATSLTIMELLYAATTTIAPDIGSDPGAPGDAIGTRPRYPILAAP